MVISYICKEECVSVFSLYISTLVLVAKFGMMVDDHPGEVLGISVSLRI
jgi:hypothetical protein